jgi:Na+-transporting NADH:ubiquinone oxidoreductase subunit F
MFSATVASTRDLTYDIKEINIALNQPSEIEQRPGQYVQIQALSKEGPVFRAYSISSPSYEKNRVELNVRIVPNGIASTYLHGLMMNDPVPLANFVLTRTRLSRLSASAAAAAWRL